MKNEKKKSRWEIWYSIWANFQNSDMKFHFSALRAEINYFFLFTSVKHIHNAHCTSHFYWSSMSTGSYHLFSLVLLLHWVIFLRIYLFPFLLLLLLDFIVAATAPLITFSQLDNLITENKDFFWSNKATLIDS